MAVIGRPIPLQHHSVEKALAKVERLTPAQQVIFSHLMAGESAREIGESLNRSRNTVINHTRVIYEVFEVNSHPRLMALFIDPGFKPPTRKKRR